MIELERHAERKAHTRIFATRNCSTHGGICCDSAVAAGTSTIFEIQQRNILNLPRFILSQDKGCCSALCVQKFDLTDKETKVARRDG